MGYLLCSLLVFITLFHNSVLDDSDETQYVVNWQDDITDCENFENKLLKLNTLRVEHINDTIVGMNGNIELLLNVPDPVKLDLVVQKEVEGGGMEYVFRYVLPDFCAHIGVPNRPWSTFIEAMHINKFCPIPKGSYPIKDVMVNIDGVSLGPEAVGKYEINLQFSGELEPTTIDLDDEEIDVLACHKLPVVVEAVQK